ncbi:MAG TPA: methyltransferase, partial [Anaerolineae bacterium]|nr:methyltransferase [Anaerolineae bacterium]
RLTGGDSKSGRHLFGHLQNAGAEILAVGASDWIVHGAGRKYPNDEAYFLNFILHFLEETLRNHPKLEAKSFSDWVKQRRTQVESGELIYIAHQMDFLVRSSHVSA